MNDDLAIPAFLKRPKGFVLPPWTPPVEEPNTFTKHVLAKVPSTETVRIGVQDHLKAKAGEFVAILEGMIDDGEITAGWSLYDYARIKDWSPQVAAKVADRYKPIAVELRAVLAGDDSELVFAYRGYTREQKLDLAAIYQGFYDDAKAYSNNEKRARAPRQKKLPSIEKKLKGFSYLKEAPDYKLRSQDPADIFGASELWLFNPTNKSLTVYRAIDKGGLQVDGCHIKNFNEANSHTKRIGRDTEENLECVIKGGKPLRDKLLKTVRGDTKEATSRVTKNHVLLRIVK
jgi:hypothetical protein